MNMVDRILDIMQSRGLMANEADARAVIEAMRDPTEAMIDAAWAEALAEDAGGVWCAMIDAMLKD